jgi:hypothetical protein
MLKEIEMKRERMPLSHWEDRMTMTPRPTMARLQSTTSMSMRTRSTKRFRPSLTNIDEGLDETEQEAIDYASDILQAESEVHYARQKAQETGH